MPHADSAIAAGTRAAGDRRPTAPSANEAVPTARISHAVPNASLENHSGVVPEALRSPDAPPSVDRASAAGWPDAPVGASGRAEWARGAGLLETDVTG